MLHGSAHYHVNLAWSMPNALSIFFWTVSRFSETRLLGDKGFFVFLQKLGTTHVNVVR